MSRSRRRAVALAVLTTVGLGAGCVPQTPSTPPVTTNTVTLPAIPLPAAASFAVSPAAIEALGCAECDLPGTPDAARFFYGRLPLASVDSIVAGSSTDARATFGNMFASGYFGGIYLRGSLGGATAEDVAPFAPLLDQIGTVTQVGLDSIVGDLHRIAATGTDQEVRDAAGAWSAVLAAIAGYNRGYLEVLLQNPPAGVTAPPVSCSGLFDCRSATLPMTALDQLAGQRDKLTSPPDFTWAAVASVANAIGGATIPAGQGVWNGILSSTAFSPAAYGAIVDLSVGFLEVTQAALYASLAGPTGGDIALARKGLDATAALMTWAGSYFLGLASSLPNTAQPTLTCL